MPLSCLCGWRLAVMAAAVAAVSPACHTASGQVPTSGKDRRVAVETAGLSRIRVERRVDVAGTLAADDLVRVSSQVAGIVSDVAVELGDEVQAGGLLVRLEPRELTLAAERAESALRQVEAQLGIEEDGEGPPPADEDVPSVRQARAARDDAGTALVRARQLTARQLLARVEEESAATRLAIAEANHQAAVDTARSLRAVLQDRRAALELARKKVSDSSIRSPVAGVVAARAAQPGEFIRENTEVVTIVRPDPLILQTAIQERHAGLIRAGQPVDFVVEAFPGQVFRGSVANVGPTVDQGTRTFRVEVLVRNADRRLRPGFFAKGTVLTHADEQVLAAPAAAVSALAGVSTVFVVEDGKARQQEVTVGTAREGLVEIVSGLKGPEQLALTNLNQLATGAMVRARPAP